jgi:DNA segregation ATPase FtsK/SpoIIIE, S-DNA-T family
VADIPRLPTIWAKKPDIVADDAADGESLTDRLAKAPDRPAIRAARARLEQAQAAVTEARGTYQTLAKRAGQAIGDALQIRAKIQAAQKWHRFEEPADELIAETFDKIPVHLLTSFTEERHRGFTLDQSSRWDDWTPPDPPVGITQSDYDGFWLRWGTYNPSDDLPLMFNAMPFIGGGVPWVVESDADSNEAAHDLLRALVLRIALMLPRQSRFTLLDPLGYGQIFPMQRFLPAVRETTGDMAADLQRIQADIRRITRDVVAFHGSFHKLPAEQQAAESYEFIIAADFPKAKAYDRRVTEMLFDIGRAGPRAGRYLILHKTEDGDLPHGLAMTDLGDVSSINLRGLGPNIADVPPPPERQRELLERLRTAAPARRAAAFLDILPPREQWWSGDSTRRIEATLDGRKDGIGITFGQVDGGTELVHGILAAAAGSGKSNLLHVLLLGLAARYAPDELHLYLMDLKQGVEFQPYARLPHAAVVAYNTDPALARAVLSELRQEMTRRYEQLFRPANTQNLTDYRNAGSPHGPAPRILLVVDEYQVLFQGSDPTEVSADLLALSSLGRAAGIHMLLGSQTFRAVGMLSQDQIFNNINIRMAMRMPAAAVHGLQDFEREGKDLIGACDLPGKVVINTGAGRDGANKLGQAVLVTAEDRSAVLDAFAEGARAWPAERRARWPRTQVFDGSRAPALADHGLARAAAAGPLNRARLAAFAQAPKHLGGLGQGDWRDGDFPVPLVLGREYAVHGEAASILRRLPNQNLALVGPSAKARLGFLAGIAASVAALAPEIATLRVVDMSRDPAVAALFAGLGARIAMTADPSAAIPAIESATGETDILLLIEPDRAPDLLRPADPLARAAGPDALERRLREGPLAGRHTILATAGASALGRVLGRRGVNLFAWRATTQMSQDDSQDVLGNRLASQLRNEGFGGPEAALLGDIDGARFTRFMPYEP